MRKNLHWNIRIEHDRLFVDDTAGERVVLQHNAHPGERPYIHPLRSVDGSACLTEDSPWHHPWQHGIQTCFVGVNGSDFWLFPGVRPGHEVGSIQATSVQILGEGPPHWGIDALWRDAAGSEVMADRQAWTLRQVPDGQTLLYLDLDWTLRAITDVRIDAYEYGGLYVRMPYRHETGAVIINSAGHQGAAAEQQPATWVDVTMPLERFTRHGDGTRVYDPLTAGIAVCDHPANRGHPARWRVDGQAGINPAPTIGGAIELPAGDELRLRYRLILHDGPVQAQRLDALWAAYAAADGGDP